MSGGGLYSLRRSEGYAGIRRKCKEWFAIIPFFGRWEKTTIVSCVAFALPAEKLFVGGLTNIFLFQKSDRAKIRRHRRRGARR